MNNTVRVEFRETRDRSRLYALREEVEVVVGTLECEHDGVRGDGGKVGVYFRIRVSSWTLESGEG